MIIVNLLLATICFGSNPALLECHNALIGKDTPVGKFTVNVRITDTKGYGGDVLQFKEANDSSVYAIHRTWLLNPKQKRDERIKSDNPKDRLITNGCINVEPEVYHKLKECCSRNGQLIIK